MSHPDLIQAIREFLVDFEMKPSTFGRLYMGDPNFVRNTEAGKEHLPRTVKRAEDAMNAARALRDKSVQPTEIGI
ncbi:MAG: hypothetical protein Q8K33_01680 [Cypionkella sp.]|uniref:hypothetical protein n=1 Tax=Cypionkella sp. TaxID=2811411 RepID=UPI0027318376|nr:hypothetical protein [Cypionkella sp.]MDP2047592.1 hypothetical protein [Cypionkella sp.]